MIKTLDLVKNGLMQPKAFKAEFTMRRMFDLELSHHAIVRPCHSTGITALDLERAEERYLLSGAKNGDIAIHDLVNTAGRPSYYAEAVCQIKSTSEYAHKFPIVTAQWYPFDTGLFITSAMDRKLKIWDTNRLKPADSVSMDYHITCHDMSNVSTQHSLIAVALKYPHVILLDPRSGSRCHELRAHKKGVTSVRWSPSSEYLLASGGIDNKIFLWDVRSARGYLRTLDQHNGEAIGSKKDVVTAHNGSVNCLRFTDDGLHLASHGRDGRLRLWDVALCKNTLVNYGPMCSGASVPGLPLSIAMCCDSIFPVVFVPNNANITFYDLFNGCKLKTLIGHFSFVSSCVFRNSSHELYSAGNDMNILLWSPDIDAESEEDKLATVQRQQQNQGNLHSDSETDNWSTEDI